MPRTEVVTMWTDYALGALAAWSSARLLLRARELRSRAIALWGLGFAGLALGAVAAGTYHGLPEAFTPQALTIVWGFVSWTMGLASFVMLCGAVLALGSGAWRSALLAAALVKLAIFALWVAGRDDYGFVLLDYGSAQLAILALAALAWRRDRAASAPWLAAGVVVSAVGAAVQQSGLGPSERFNHNDLYHVIQMLGIYLLYRGGARFARPAAVDNRGEVLGTR